MTARRPLPTKLWGSAALACAFAWGCAGQPSATSNDEGGPAAMNAGGGAPPGGGGASSNVVVVGQPPLPGQPQDPTVFVPAEGGLRRLTVPQYRNSVSDLFGAAALPSVALEKDTALSGLASIGAARLALSAPITEQFEGTKEVQTPFAHVAVAKGHVIQIGVQ